VLGDVAGPQKEVAYAPTKRFSLVAEGVAKLRAGDRSLFYEKEAEGETVRFGFGW
jgi:hypothetical protein